LDTSAPRMSFNLDLSKKAADTKKQSASIFKMDDEEENEEEASKNALSKTRNVKTGYQTKVAQIYQVGRRHYSTTSGMPIETKKHHLQRPLDKFFSDKLEKIEKDEAETKRLEQEKIESILEEGFVQEGSSVQEQKLLEIEKLKELIRIEKEKIKICYLCKRKFANEAHLKRHEEESEMHKANMNK